MEEQDLRQCTAYGEDKFICISHQPVYNLHDEDAPCEAKVFSQQTSLSCLINDVTCKETWTKLHKPNLWLFTLCDKQLMRVICSDQVTPAVIDGTGIILLKPKCILQKKDATIITYNHLGSNVYMKPDIEVPTINSTINHIFDLGWKNAHLNIIEHDTETASEVMRINQQLEDIKHQEVLPKASDLSSHDIYHYSITSLLLGGLAVLALYFLRKRCRKVTPATDNTVKQKGKDNIAIGEEIDLQEVSNLRSVAPVHSGQGQQKKMFNFEEFI
ncbi:hypothetical protein HF086_017192 [Spodoptera exigua]|uniref:Uncharacterized protein n=1 Tax=Spodoptera exigua TaxID=7107 RepID=A0A922SFE9_SPOEX|nr:hypothetical protein HF086_017192 [Spodoptera exigua]